MGKKKRHHRIHREGRGIIVTLTFLIFAINVPIYLYVSNWIFAITLLLSAALLVFVTYFFRNPMRILEVSDPNLLIAPADGRVVVTEPTTENEYFHDRRLQVSIFMSPFNVHANWYPVKGIVNYVKHHKGRHTAAYLPKSSNENEHSSIGMTSEGGTKILIKQIAGALAQRIVTYAKEGKAVHINEQLGFIKFGSRVDIFLPLDTEIYVKVGDKTTGNETIIARLNE